MIIPLANLSPEGSNLDMQVLLQPSTLEKYNLPSVLKIQPTQAQALRRVLQFFITTGLLPFVVVNQILHSLAGPMLHFITIADSMNGG